jgi:hypothetical protein
LVLKAQEVNVWKTSMNIVLKEDSELKEVIVIGYGTVKKERCNWCS